MNYFGMIYKMANLLNKKVYIGQTKTSLSKRFKSHMKSAKRKDRKKLQLQKDLLIHHFDIKTIHYCSSKKEMDLMEIYYTEKYRKEKGEKLIYNIRTGSKYGYHNEKTKKLVSMSNKGRIAWNKNKKCPQFAGKNNGMFGQYGKQKTSKPVIMINKNGNKIRKFVSIGKAVQYLKSIGFEKAAVSLISAVCLGKRKSIYGYKWKYVN